MFEYFLYIFRRYCYQLKTEWLSNSVNLGLYFPLSSDKIDKYMDYNYLRKNMDKIIIKGIRFHGHHGVPEAERQVGGQYEIDATLSYPIADAGRTDALEDTIDYASVVNLIEDIGIKRSFRLIEALAETIAIEILQQYPIDTVHLTVKKLNPPIKQPITYFAVEICRSKE